MLAEQRRVRKGRLEASKLPTEVKPSQNGKRSSQHSDRPGHVPQPISEAMILESQPLEAFSLHCPMGRESMLPLP